MDEAAESCGYPVQYECLFATQMIEVAGEMVPISKMVEDLHIDINAYASSELLRRWDLIARLYFAGIKTIPFTEWSLQTFENIGDRLYPLEKQQLLDREFETFGKRRVGLYEAMPVEYWRTATTVYRHPRTNIVADQ